MDAPWVQAGLPLQISPRGLITAYYHKIHKKSTGEPHNVELEPNQEGVAVLV
jgi:hypothetical protein